MYRPSTLEKWVSEKFIEKGIIYPHELDPRLISSAFGILYEPGPLPSLSGESSGIPYIVVDTRLPTDEQREQFFHELGHVLRHYGNQNTMPDMFRDLQEWDAKLFTLYAAIPYHMLDFTVENTVHSLMERFSVPLHLAQKRIELIRERYSTEKPKPKRSSVLDPFNPQKYSKETQRLLKQLRIGG